MYINLGSCDDTLSARRLPSGVTFPRKPHATVHKKPSTKLFQSHRAPSLYGIRTLSGLGEYEDDNLGKFKLKKVVKSVAKVATKATKVALTPIAYTASSSLNAVGLRNAAGKVNKAVAISKGELKTLNAASKAAGWAIDAAGVVVGGAVAAPYVASAASSVGSGASGLFSSVGGGGLLSKIGGSGLLSKLTGLIKKPSSGGGGSSGSDSGSATGAGFMDTAKSVMSDLGLTPSTAQEPTAGLPMPFQGAANGGASAPAAGGDAAGGDGAAAPAGTTEAGVNPLMGDLSGFLSNPKMLLVAAGGTFLLYMVNRKKSGGRSRRGGRK